MARPDRWFDWHGAFARDRHAPLAADPQRRIMALAVGVAICFTVVFARCVMLEVSEGDAFRAVAAKVWSETTHQPAPRGRILARDGTPLAEDTTRLAVTVPYRYLQQRSDPRWLRRLARKERRSLGTPVKEPFSATVDRLRVQHADMHRQLADLAGITHEEWNARCRRIEHRVERMAEHVNRRRRESHAQQQAAAVTAVEVGDNWGGLVVSSVRDLFAPPSDLPPPRITIREEVERHVMAVGISREAAATIERHPERYPGVRVERENVRSYPCGGTAAHLVGYLGPPEAGKLDAMPDAGEATADSDIDLTARVGRVGVERAWEQQLRGVTGVEIHDRDAGGQLLATHAARSVEPGRDVRLTIDLALQSAAEQLLDQIQRQRATPLVHSRAKQVVPNHGGGSIIAMDIQSGELLACASAPRFDPNLFVAGKTISRSQSAELERLFSDPHRALFHRATQMALPPGSVFKPLVAVALMESDRGVDPDAPLVCRGYLRQPHAQRCYIFRHYGVGHGPITMREALARSCNVYFYQQAGSLGAGPIVNWASRFGFGQATGLDLPGETRGNLSSPRSLQEQRGETWQLADTEALSIGQGTLTVTPLQIVRMMAAIGSGGRLVAPRLIADGSTHAAAQQIALRQETLAAVRSGMRQAVEDPDGTAHRAFADLPIAVAGKTGTAEAGGDQQDHAWFAGYAPAENPQVAFVVVLEHGGGGGTVAAPVARRLVGQLQRLGYLERAVD